MNALGICFSILCIASITIQSAVTIDEKGLPSGSWQESCQNPRYDKNTKRLTADCKTSYEHFKKAADTHRYTPSSLVIDEPQEIKDIQNHNGWLVAVLENGKYPLPEGTYKDECTGCEVLLTNDAVGNKVFCVRCLCALKDSKGKTTQEARVVCHPELLTLQNPIVVVDGLITLNPKYLPQGDYLKSCKQCSLNLGFRRADAKAENGLELSCVCPSTTKKMYNTYLRVTDIRDFLDTPKNISNTHGILTHD